MDHRCDGLPYRYILLILAVRLVRYSHSNPTGSYQWAEIFPYASLVFIPQKFCNLQNVFCRLTEHKDFLFNWYIDWDILTYNWCINWGILAFNRYINWGIPTFIWYIDWGILAFNWYINWGILAFNWCIDWSILTFN